MLGHHVQQLGRDSQGHRAGMPLSPSAVAVTADEGLTPLDYAKREKKREVIEYLESLP